MHNSQKQEKGTKRKCLKTYLPVEQADKFVTLAESVGVSVASYIANLVEKELQKVEQEID